MAYLPAAQRPTKRLKLISSPDHWIDYYSTLNWSDRKALRQVALKDQTAGEDYFSVASDVALSLLIADWSLDDADGNKLPITQESIDLLDDRDADALLDALATVVSPKKDAETEHQKKSGGKTPTPPSAAEAKTPQ